MNFFITSKAWIIFVVLIIPFLIGAAISLENPSSLVVLLFWLISMVLVLGWLYSLGNALFQHQSNKQAGSVQVFRLNIILSLMIFLSIVLLNNFMKQHTVALLFLMLCSFFTYVYVLFFTAKYLALREKKVSVSFADYAGYFFLLWFFPIGIWFIQPKIQMILARHTSG